MNAAQPRFNSKFHPFNFARLVLFSLIFYFVFSSPDVFAATLPEYLGNIKAAKILIEDFADLDAAAFSNWEYLKIERETLTRTRAALPASERVEWQGGSIETNNQWLAEKLDRYQREPRVSARRAAILEEIVEQLDALERKVGELENAPAASRAKDEDKRKLAEILQREEYQKPEQASGNLLEKIYNRVVKWLAEMFPRANISPSSATNFSSLSFILQLVLYALILGAIGFLVYRFAPFFAVQFRFKERAEKKARVVLGERLTADETARSLFGEAERLAGEGDLRGAIRKGYIAFLCELSERKIIGLSQHKTNRDYLRDVCPKSELYENMSGLTGNYERHWYGSDAARETDWTEFKEAYQKAIGV
jgi:hypothetical protein